MSIIFHHPLQLSLLLLLQESAWPLPCPIESILMGDCTVYKSYRCTCTCQVTKHCARRSRPCLPQKWMRRSHTNIESPLLRPTFKMIIFVFTVVFFVCGLKGWCCNGFACFWSGLLVGACFQCFGFESGACLLNLRIIQRSRGELAWSLISIFSD